MIVKHGFFPSREFSLAEAKASVGAGWEDLIELAYAALELQSDPCLSQVKEKFGGLRFYCSMGDTEAFNQLIRDIENLSYRMCEVCGQPGTHTPNLRGWIKTLCPTHMAGR